MKEEKHTSGPWSVRDAGFVDIMAEGTHQVAIVKGYSIPQQMANAHLIAAAPEILGALEEAIMQFEANAHYSDDDRAVIIRMAGAIAKAKGEL